MDVPQIPCMMRQQGQPRSPPGRAALILPTANPAPAELNHSSCPNLGLVLPITDLLACFFRGEGVSGSALAAMLRCVLPEPFASSTSPESSSENLAEVQASHGTRAPPARAAPAAGQRVLAAKAALPAAAVVCSLGHPDAIGGRQEMQVRATAVGVAGICKTVRLEEKTPPHA